MEKLIELLNEFGNINRNKEMIDRQDTYIISKRFGFIERLVENNKIEKLEIVIGENEDYKFPDVFDFTEQVIMSLSMSDTPIEDLIKLLK